MNKFENIIDFLCALDQLSKKHDIYLEIDYEDGISLVNTKGEVVATEFYRDDGIGYECYND